MIGILIVVIIIIIILYFIFKPSSENFSDKEKFNNSVILYNNLSKGAKKNKIDFDKYKSKLRDYPDLLDVTIYDKVKQLKDLSVTNIYNQL
jgi:hypothetical protein